MTIISTKLEKSLINRLQRHGAHVEKSGSRREPFFTVEMVLGDEASNVLMTHFGELGDIEEDPFVQIVQCPPTAGVTPRFNMVLAIMNEASAVVQAFQPLLPAAFAPGQPAPLIGPPVVLPGPGLRFHHASISLHAVCERSLIPGRCVQPYTKYPQEPYNVFSTLLIATA